MEPNIWQVYRDRGVQLIAVNRIGVTTGSREQVELFVDTTGITFPVGFDLSNSYADLRAAAPIGSSPNSVHVIIDRAGKIAYFSQYYAPGQAPYDFAPILDSLLAP